MPANSDHIRRDAEHAARSHIRVDVQAILRRLDETAKAHIGERLARANPGEVIDGKSLGYEAAEIALAVYVVGDLSEPIEASATPAIES
jgi:hypothetical protein